MNSPLTHAVVLLAAVALAAPLSGCADEDLYAGAAELTGGDPARGRAAVRAHGCSSCHTIPGVDGADSLVGPPLNHLASRTYIGGVLPNTPDNLVRWILNAPGVDPQTAMPNLHLSEQEARDIAGYLYTLK